MADPNVSVQLAHFRSVMAGMMDSKATSDLTLDCNGELFHVHTAIVYPQSKPIKAAVENGHFTVCAFVARPASSACEHALYGHPGS